ncbi:hypothetical protein DFH06DRAFT_1482086 [Mycena polygramma]|nr:hypothetical protein DFH06DRAFT_1482086 [Mycena polygramma]
MDSLLPNSPLDASQTRIVRSQLASTLSELSTLEETILKLSLVSAELQRQKNWCIDSVAAMRNALSPIHATPPEILAEVFRMCRDSSLTSPSYSIFHASQAPLVLTRVSSRWRSICFSTRHLWNHFRIHLGPDSILPPETVVCQLLTRSGVLPLHVHIVASDIVPSLWQVFTALLQDQGRFQSLHLDLVPSDLPSAIWRQNGTFPLLASVNIYVDDDDADHTLPDMIRLFANAPCIQTVEIAARCAPAAGWVSAFRWCGLTALDLHIHLDLNTGRQILMQCSRVQKCRMVMSNDPAHISMQRPQEISSLVNLYNLSLCFDFDIDELPLQFFFEAFAFPSLTHLNVVSHCWTTEILVDLYHRSHFTLEELYMANIDLSTLDIIPFLQLVPSLRTIEFQSYGFNDMFLAAFTCNADTEIPTLTLPHLRSAVFDDKEFEASGVLVTGPAVLSLAESLYRCTGENAAFPALESVILNLSGSSFDFAIERRLVEICSASVLRYRHIELPRA